jgi:hypothetical protein
MPDVREWTPRPGLRLFDEASGDEYEHFLAEAEAEDRRPTRG